MATSSKAGSRTTPASIPISNINTYVRVPGYPPYPLGRALQEWDDVDVTIRMHKDPGEVQDARLIREVQFTNAEGTFKVVVNEQVYETALYTRASKRFAEWMRAQRDKSSA